MNSTKYRKIVLTENWADNNFIMIKEKVSCFPCPYSINFQISHPKILSGEAFWVAHDELCIGYYLGTNPDVFRPIFSHQRQILLDIVHDGEDEYNISNPHLRYARKKYLVGLDREKELPMDCIEIILSFIHTALTIYHESNN